MASRTYRKTCDAKTSTSALLLQHRNLASHFPRIFLSFSSHFPRFPLALCFVLHNNPSSIALTHGYLFRFQLNRRLLGPSGSTSSHSRHQHPTRIRSLVRKGFFQLVVYVKSGQRAAWHSNGLDGNSACPQPLQPSISLERIAMDRDTAQRGASPSNPMSHITS